MLLNACGHALGWLVVVLVFGFLCRRNKAGMTGLVVGGALSAAHWFFVDKDPVQIWRFVGTLTGMTAGLVLLYWPRKKDGQPAE